jgi:hypothetical protein
VASTAAGPLEAFGYVQLGLSFVALWCAPGIVLVDLLGALQSLHVLR